MAVDDIKEFELLLHEKRHKDIILVLNAILDKLLEIKITPEVSVNTDTSKIEELIKTIGSQGGDDIPNSIKAIGEVISKNLENIKLQQTIPATEWVFNIERDDAGFITVVRASGE